MGSLAQPEDVAVSLVRSLTPSEQEYAPKLIERAQSLIEERVPSLSQLTEVGGENYDPSFVARAKHIIADSVARVFRNPEAYRQETEGNYSYTLDREAASGLLSISDSEWERLGVVVGDEYGTMSVGYDAYAKSRYGSDRPDLVFQYGWPGDKPGMSERIY